MNEENKRVLNLYKQRKQYLLEMNEELELVKIIKEMKEIEKKGNCRATYDNMNWGELVLHYLELFDNKIKEYEFYLNK